MSKVISAVLGRSVKGQAFPSLGCVNHINTQTETLPLRTRLQPSSGACAAGATLSLLHATLYCTNSFSMEMLLYVLNIHSQDFGHFMDEEVDGKDQVQPTFTT